MMLRFLHKGRAKAERWFNQLWYLDEWLAIRYVLLPFSYVYQSIVRVRRAIEERFLQQHVPIPLIIVGNLTVGGVGKTPLVIALANRLKQQGVQVAIVSRGYGAKVKQFPHRVLPTDSALWVGDEPLLIAKRTGCPVVIAPKRMDAVRHVLKDDKPPQVILSDDGLQHYRMGRQLEILAIDGTRQLGNRYCLPAGPLRESVKRLDEVDFIVMNGANTCLAETSNRRVYSMQIQACELRHLATDKIISADELKPPVAAIAGIGHPERFFSSLRDRHITHQAHVFPDHHVFKQRDFEKLAKTVVMTEKDAVKCASFATETMYYLPIEATLSNDFWDALWLKLGRIA